MSNSIDTFKLGVSTTNDVIREEDEEQINSGNVSANRQKDIDQKDANTKDIGKEVVNKLENPERDRQEMKSKNYPAEESKHQSRKIKLKGNTEQKARPYARIQRDPEPIEFDSEVSYIILYVIYNKL